VSREVHAGICGSPGLKCPGLPDRPGRGCHDAIEAIFQVAKGANPARQWVLDADLTAAFDRIDHGHLLDAVGGFPGRERITGWLRAGVVENGTSSRPRREHRKVG
jgi:retron-type reverse transcriptase